ncbi:NADP-dependent 3-hydroxy acid dehydrogenase YdfG [Neolewinella xylanilytica]|uniref:NADP-dependent 3-hydroxy acid dehydrogenase YdfG n=1 Tax=Neolewinella xylanilytica TaxID=1514080 RepID=A0A2S6I628_9BACT|nr:SDR family NAD(P)-dependent oxidoreductase [Neolewinella xylanilytica]PPK86589.1 NADP-dependent 3-hydroxy acid dehydrogenase YdfG [Neolewinella xylanilytica]
MSILAIAYSQEDLSAAQRISAAVEADIELEHYPVGRANDGELLTDILRKNRLPLILLISDSLLTNPNAMQGLIGVMERTDQILPLVIDAHRLEPSTGEVISVETRLFDRTDVMHYLSHWQDRYIELRRGGDDYTDAVSQHAFKAYLRKIRETSVGVEEVLEQLLDLDPLPDRELREADYDPIYQLAGLPAPEPAQQHQEESTASAAEQSEGGASGAGVTMRDKVADHSGNDRPGSEPADAIIRRAWRMSDAGNTEEALEELTEGREDRPEHAELHYQYALMLALAADRIDAARTEITELLTREPNHAEALFLAGELHLAAGDYLLARQRWQRLADLQPGYPELNQRLGYLLTDHFPADHREAATYLSRATKDSSVRGETYYRYGKLLAGPLDRPKKAFKALQMAVEIDPEHAPAHYLLAVLEFDRGRLNHARQNFLLAVNLEPAYGTPANRRAFSAGHHAPPVEKKPPVASDALSALKQNIAELEAMLSDREAPHAEVKVRRGAGKTVFLSGATSGIGLATARRLAEEGYRLILAARRKERLDAVARELRNAAGIDVHTLELDVTDRERVGEELANLPEAWRAIDILINNAGKAKGFDPIHRGDLDHWDEMIDVNLRGLLYVTRAISPGMVARKGGTIINVASTAGKEVYPNGNVYCATKHAVDALTHSMRLDLVEHGIRVGQICPAHVEETEFALVRFDGDRERAKIYQDFQPLRSRDVAETIHFMISQPPHVNILDVVLQGTQQASSTVVDRSGRARFAPEEE